MKFLEKMLAKIKAKFRPQKRLERPEIKKWRVQGYSEQDIEEAIKQLDYLDSEIHRFTRYIYNGNSDENRWRHGRDNCKRKKPFVRPNSENDTRERDDLRDNFKQRLLEAVPDNFDLRFHGTPIYNAKSIIESGGIISSLDRSEYMPSTDSRGLISASRIDSVERTINFHLDIDGYKECLPCGCIFVLLPITERDKTELKEMDQMENVNFHENPDQLYSIITTSENISSVQEWLISANMNPDLVCTYKDFISKVEKGFKARLDAGKEIKDRVVEIGINAAIKPIGAEEPPKDVKSIG